MITIKGLRKSYGTKEVLSGVSLTVPDASVFGLVGINGAGKTTLLRMMADVLRPDEGTVEYDGENIARNTKKRKERLKVLHCALSLYLPDYIVTVQQSSSETSKSATPIPFNTASAASQPIFADLTYSPTALSLSTGTPIPSS